MTGQRLALFATLLLGAFWFPSKEDVHVTQAKIPLLVSAAGEADGAFVHSSWKRSALDAPKNHARRAEGRVGEHFTNYNRVVFEALSLPQTQVLVARAPDDPTFIYGWIAFALLPSKTTAVHYLYVKSKFRRLGIASHLKDELGKLEPKGARRYFCESTSHDATFCRWGFEYAPLDEVLKGCEPKRRARRTA